MEDDEFDKPVELKEENKFNRWISPIEMKLGSVKHERVKACSISSVPEKLRSSKVEAYKPKVVSIGPLHRGTNKDLLYMEEIKWRCSHSLFNRTDEARKSGGARETNEARKRLVRCSKAILNLVEVLHATYLDEIKIESYELAKIMLLDGCFLLELLITSSDTGINAPESEFPGPGSEVGKMEKVLSDLKLLENQIPLFILDTLLKELLNAKCKDCLRGIRIIINEQVLFLFGYASRDENTPANQDAHVPETAHFLEHIHWCITQNEKEKQDKKDEKREHVVVSIAGQESLQPQLGNCNSKGSPEPKPKLRYCATRLNVAGVKIGPPDGDDQRQIFKERLEEKKHLDNPLVLVSVALGCYKYFSEDGKRLEIHPLHITEKTQVELRNFIAWEQSRMTHQRFSEKTGCAFSEYVSLLNDLVCCEEDVKLLKSQGVLYAKNLSDEDLMKFLRAIVDHIQIDAGEDSSFKKMINRLNNSGPGISCRILCHRFKSCLEYTKYGCRTSIQTLIRDHAPTGWKAIGVLAAIVLLLLTVAQTVFGAIGL